MTRRGEVHRPARRVRRRTQQWLLFEGYERRIDKINSVPRTNTASSLSKTASEICNGQGHRPLTRSSRASSPSPLRTPCWAYTLGAAIAIKKGVQERRRGRRGHRRGPAGLLHPRLRRRQTARSAWATATWAPCCCATRPSASAFLAGHESFAAAEGAIGIARNANKARKKPLRVILNGLGKDAAQIISRINGFTYVKTEYRLLHRRAQGRRENVPYSDGERAAVNCYGADDVREGVAIM